MPFTIETTTKEAVKCIGIHLNSVLKRQLVLLLMVTSTVAQSTKFFSKVDLREHVRYFCHKVYIGYCSVMFRFYLYTLFIDACFIFTYLLLLPAFIYTCFDLYMFYLYNLLLRFVFIFCFYNFSCLLPHTLFWILDLLCDFYK